MDERPLQDVTLPILIEASGEQSDGWITLPGPNGGHTTRNVHRAQAIQSRGSDLSSAIYSLRDAIITREPELLRRAIEGAGAWIDFPGVETTYDFAGKSVDRLIHAARSDYAFLMSVALKDVQVAVWSPGNGSKSPRLAMYCPDETAAAFMLTAAHQARRCANSNCRALFTPASKRQKYHSPQCGIATRTRKSRVKAKKKVDASNRRAEGTNQTD